MSRRVVITGIGTLNPLSTNGVEDTWKKLLAGQSGTKTITQFDLEGLRAHIIASIKDFDPEKYHLDRKLCNKMDKFQQISFAGAVEASLQAQIPLRHPENHEIIFDEFKDMSKAIEDPYRMGTMLGIGVGGMQSFSEQDQIMHTRGARRVSPFFVPKLIVNLAGGWVSQSTGAMGVNTTFVTACASGNNAIGESFLAIKHDRADIIYTGGFESAVCKLAIAGFGNMHALSTRNDDPGRASRPFDKDRDGFIFGEGGAMLVLEELEHAKKRGANILAEVVGYGLTADAYHITSPSPSGEGAKKAMLDAINMAEINPEDVDYINAHGTSTGANDRMETKAIKDAFGKSAYDVNISSTKSMTGHMLGGAGAFEAMVIAKACQDNKIPPTINLDNPDEGMDLNYTPHNMVEREVNYAMSNSFGFGGHNAVVLFKKYK